MNIRHAFTAATLALLASSAFAGGEFDPLTGFSEAATPVAIDAAMAPARSIQATRANGVTRAEVRAEFLRARHEGELVSFDTGMAYAQVPVRPSTLTREQVRDETRQAMRAKGMDTAGS